MAIERPCPHGLTDGRSGELVKGLPHELRASPAHFHENRLSASAHDRRDPATFGDLHGRVISVAHTSKCRSQAWCELLTSTRETLEDERVFVFAEDCFDPPAILADAGYQSAQLGHIAAHHQDGSRDDRFVAQQRYRQADLLQLGFDPFTAVCVAPIEGSDVARPCLLDRGQRWPALEEVAGL